MEALIVILESTLANKGIVRTRNPRTKRYFKIDSDKVIIISMKKSTGLYKNVPIITKQVG